MFHTDDKSLPQIIISLPQMIIFVSHGITQICTDYFHTDHSPFKRRTNQSSPLQGELEGVANIPMFRMENNPCLSAICGRIKNTIRMANSCHNHSQLCCVKGKSGEGSDTPSTLERSGSERRVVAVNIPCPMRGKGLGESGGASLQGKGGRVGFRKRLYLLSYSMYLLP